MVAKISICMHAYYFPNSIFSMQVLHNITRILFLCAFDFCRISAAPPVKRYLNARAISKVICGTKYRTKSSSSALHYNPHRS